MTRGRRNVVVSSGKQTKCSPEDTTTFLLYIDTATQQDSYGDAKCTLLVTNFRLRLPKKFVKACQDVIRNCRFLFGEILAVGTGESVPKLLEREVRAPFGDTPHALTATWTSRRCRERLPKEKPTVPSPLLSHLHKVQFILSS